MGKTDFQDGRHGSHLRFPIETIFLFLICKLPRYFLLNFASIVLSVKEKFKIDFQENHHGGHLGFLIGPILAIFDLHVTMILPTKFRVSWPLVSGDEGQNRFSRWPPWRISDRKDFSYF